MKESDQPTGKEDYYALANQILKNRKKLNSTSHEGWSIDCYKGHRPDSEDASISQIEYGAYAKTGDLSKSQVPVLSTSPRVIRVDFDDASVVTLTAKSFEELTSDLQSIFKGFHWNKEN
jgi:hypothetical protein|tara:strand:- start:3602 stop:3958 length:357 start_codon:yes stop_codon:yes gene_type:complete